LSSEEVELNGRKGGVEEELKEVEPLIQQARKAVGSIKSDNINEIRSLKMPPDAIRDVLEGVLLLMGNPDTSWMNMKKFLGQRSVKEEIINFDARKVTPRVRAQVAQLLAEKGNSFEHQVIYRVSVAAAPLAAWVKANLKFSMVLEKIAPLELELNQLRDSLDESKNRLVQCEEDLVSLDAQVSELKDDFALKTQETGELKFSLKNATDQLEAAQSLLGKLGGEKDRWEEQVGYLEEQLLTLPLNSLLSAGFITYLAAASEDKRQEMVKRWQRHLGLEEYSFTSFMSKESEMLVWKAEGLPSDGLSMENAIVILHSTQVPYIIDPSTAATTWLKGHIKTLGGTLEMTTIQDERFTTTMELAVRFGKTLVVDEVDTVEPVLYTILRKDLLRQGTRLMIQIGEKTVDYHENFRLYLATRNPYPTIPPDAASLVGVTNFTVTHSGMESQLLGLTIQHEQPELEHQKSQLLQQEEELKVQLAELEKSLLQTLATSEGNILENKKLIDALSETKAKSITIKDSLQESEELQYSLDEQRNVYKPVAERGALMFFLMRDLRSLNHMYQFSLNLFLRLFRKALEAPAATGDVDARIAHLAQTLLSIVFAYTSRSLFKTDRLTFGMHFVRYLHPEHFDEPAWDLFLGTLVEQAGRSTPARPGWIPSELQHPYTLLVGAAPSILTNFNLQDTDRWDAWHRSPNAEANFPSGSERQNPFHRLLITQAFRSDRLELAMGGFICAQLGIPTVAPPSTSIAKLHEMESTAAEPILFITTPGADPSQELEEFAGRLVGRGRYHQVCM
jgi:dynein heavy chain 2